MIRFNIPPVVGTEKGYISEALARGRLSGDNHYAQACQTWFETTLGCEKALLTPSCTHALEMAALLVGIEPGDEVIMPSYTFVSTANAFALRGAGIVFVDIRPDTMNIDETLIEDAITRQTKAIVPVHYAGVSCEMDRIVEIGAKHDIPVIEDAAQSITSTYNGELSGTHGCLSAYSFHETKNLTAGGEGGVLIVNDPGYVDRAMIIREKGTNRVQFFKGEVDKYTWVDLGSSYLPSELQSAYLYGQLMAIEKIQDSRLRVWNRYHELLAPHAEKDLFELPVIPVNCQHNGHMFYLKVADKQFRTRVLKRLKDDGIMAVFHYIPLHSAPYGRKIGRFHGHDQYTTSESERIIRMPLWYNMDLESVDFCVERLLAALKD